MRHGDSLTITTVRAGMGVAVQNADLSQDSRKHTTASNNADGVVARLKIYIKRGIGDKYEG